MAAGSWTGDDPALIAGQDVPDAGAQGVGSLSTAPGSIVTTKADNDRT